MKKTILFRLFGLGAFPKKFRPTLDSEEIVVADEGLAGWFVTKNVKGPGKRYINRIEGFSGCLAVTKKRIVCFSYSKCQINVSIEDPRISDIFVCVPKAETLSIFFESSTFRDGWTGMIEFRFRTEKAQQFYETLKSIGAQPGISAKSD